MSTSRFVLKSAESVNASNVAAKHAEIANRYRWHQRQKQNVLALPSVPDLRLRELERLARHRKRRGDTMGEVIALRTLAELRDSGEIPGPSDLGHRVGLTWQERRAADIRTFRAIDRPTPEEARAIQEEKRQRRNALKRYRRWAKGTKSQEDSISRKKPWIALGVSRATYYRRRPAKPPSFYVRQF